MMDPVANSIGDYNIIMGNTGGDAITEFDPRIPHSIFYDSPKWNGMSVLALYSPSQKLRNLSGSAANAYAQGERVCAGFTPGPDAGSTLCNHGASKNVYSVAISYEMGPWLGTFSYERHQRVDRTGDNGGVTSSESAAKLGVSYLYDRNRLSLIYEKFYRGGGIPSSLNERDRHGFYISDVQDLGNNLDVIGAWAHASRTPGSPNFGNADDSADMYVLGLKYHFDKQTSVSLIGALLSQGDGAHFTLGAGGHGAPLASPRNDAGGIIPGTAIKALSVEMQYAF